MNVHHSMKILYESVARIWRNIANISLLQLTMYYHTPEVMFNKVIGLSLNIVICCEIKSFRVHLKVKFAHDLKWTYKGMSETIVVSLLMHLEAVQTL